MGNKASGSMAVAAKGIASVIHQTAIKTTVQAVAKAGSGMSDCVFRMAAKMQANTGPIHRPLRLIWETCLESSSEFVSSVIKWDSSR